MSKPNTHWNHRVIKHGPDGSGETWYEIHEVYYRNGKPEMWTEEAVGVRGTTPKELLETLKRMKRATGTPTLEIVGKKLREIK